MNTNTILNLLFAHSILGMEELDLNEELIKFINKNKLNCVLSVDNPHQEICLNLPDAINRESHFDMRVKKAKISEMIKICQFLDEYEIDYTVVKGPILSLQLYDNPYIRYYSDIDILINDFEDKVLDIMAYLKEMGYFQYLGWNLKREIDNRALTISERIDHHEVVFVKGINDIFKIEIKNAMSAVPRTLIPEFNKHIHDYYIEGYSVKSFDLMHSFLALCCNVFINTESRSAIFYGAKIMRHYYDLYIFIQKYNDRLHVSTVFDLAEKYNFSYRLERVFSNLHLLLTYNKEIEKSNNTEIKWLKAILKLFKHIHHLQTISEKDVFLESEPNQHEIVNWGYDIVQRTFSECRIECITNYKKQYFQYTYKELRYTPFFQEKELYIIVNSPNYSLLISKKYIHEHSCKIELLADERQQGVLFRGIIVEESVGNKVVVFTSNAKHYEEYLDEYVEVSNCDAYLVCDITELISKSICNEKCIFRISNVQRMNDMMYQELDSASYQYRIRR